MKEKHSRSGFTMIELLVSVSFIGGVAWVDDARYQPGS